MAGRAVLCAPPWERRQGPATTAPRFEIGDVFIGCLLSGFAVARQSSSHQAARWLSSDTELLLVPLGTERKLVLVYRQSEKSGGLRERGRETRGVVRDGVAWLGPRYSGRAVCLGAGSHLFRDSPAKMPALPGSAPGGSPGGIHPMPSRPPPQGPGPPGENCAA